ncbi:hypothetical protein [Streptomyces sp. NPDC046832]|uniref:nucleotide sugar dehydrogenase n=1 Tax=Streptomyces sp. NPDC046832 TaxID=3155020 RepID=UPI0033F2367B
MVLESTTYPGTTRDVLIPLLEEGSGLMAGRDFHVGFSPERIDPGNPTWKLENTPKVVAGLTEACLARVKDFYDCVVEVTVPASGLEEAELAKVFENTFRHVNIALVNELAKLGHLLNIDVGNALDCAATKPFGFMRFTPGPGVGGHCCPSTRSTSPITCANAWGRRSASSNWPRRSTNASPSMSSTACKAL